MKSAVRLVISSIGTIMGLGGLEHGIGEILQGSVAPNGIMIQSWPDSAFFQSLSGEPAMTIIPNLLIAGILTILVSLVFLAWVIGFIHRKNGGLILILLSILMLLVGGGIFPPVLGMILGAAGMRMNALAGKIRTSRTSWSSQFLMKAFPGFCVACVVCWLALFPGMTLLDYFLGISNVNLTLALMGAGFGFLFLAFIAGFTRDRQRLTSRIEV